MNALFQLASVFYSEADTYRATVEKIIETVHSHTFAVELAAKLLENGISTPDQLLTRLQVEKASFHNEDKIKIIKDTGNPWNHLSNDCQSSASQNTF